MSILNEIFDKYLTDKGTKFDAKHGYGKHYDNYLHHFRDKDIKLLEVGIYKGNSIRAWREYFTKAYIYGIDSGMVVPVDTSLNELDNVKVDTVDVFTPDFPSFVSKHGPFDIIVDDCSHKLDNQKIIFQTTYDFLNKGGLYVIEDIEHVAGNKLNDVKEVLFRKGITPDVWDSDYAGTKILFFIKR